MRNGRWLKIGVLLGLCLMVCSCKDEAPKQQGPMAIPVAVYNIKEENYPWDAEFQAQASGSKSVEVRARVEAIIEKRLYKEGDFVREGQQLFQLERDVYEARMEQAQAQFTNAEREWRRVRPLYEKNAVSQKERDAALAAYETARAELKTAQINLDYCQVVSPVNGYSSKEIYTPGNLVSNNSLLTYVNQTEPMYIDFSIAAPERMLRENLAAQGKLEMPARNIYRAHLKLLDGTECPETGHVTFIDSKVQPETGVIQARATFANEDGIIMPGQYVRITMSGDVLTNAILIPQKCVIQTQQGSSVMTVDENDIVSVVPVTIVATVEDRYLIGKGLKAGQRIISEGIVKARVGSKVSIMPPMEDSEPNISAKPDQEKPEPEQK